MAAPKLLFTFALLFAVAAAVQPITDFYKGELTYFGGSPDGMDPANPSYGTLEVRIVTMLYHMSWLSD